MGVYVNVQDAEGAIRHLKIEFSHDPYSEVRGNVLTKKNKFKEITIVAPRTCYCRICEMTGTTVPQEGDAEAAEVIQITKKVLVERISTCSPEDVYNKNDGRIFAFSRALFALNNERPGEVQLPIDVIGHAYISRTGEANVLESMKINREMGVLYIQWIDGEIDAALVNEALKASALHDAKKAADKEKYSNFTIQK